jgi:hypothetical protein
MVLDFCEIKVKIIHDLIEEVTSVDEPPQIDQYQTLDIDNEIVDIELKLYDHIDSSTDTFTLTLWNLPDDTVIVEGDYLQYNFGWSGDSKLWSGWQYVRINDVSYTIDGMDSKWELKGDRLERYLFTKSKITNPDYKKIGSLSEYFALVSTYGFTNVYCQIPEYTVDTEFSNFITTEGKTAYEVADEIIELIKDETSKPIRMRIQNQQNLIFYSADEDFIQEDVYVNTFVTDEVFKFKDSTSKIEGQLYYIYFEIFGTPKVEAGGLIRFDEEVYKVEEVTHEITISSGYEMKVLAYRAIPVSEEEA